MSGGVTASGQFFELTVTVMAALFFAVLYECCAYVKTFVKFRFFEVTTDFLWILAGGALLWFAVLFSNDGEMRYYHIIGFIISFLIFNRIFKHFRNFIINQIKRFREFYVAKRMEKDETYLEKKEAAKEDAQLVLFIKKEKEKKPQKLPSFVSARLEKNKEKRTAANQTDIEKVNRKRAGQRKSDQKKGQKSKLQKRESDTARN